MNCIKCGQEMPKGSLYCNKCGAYQATNPTSRIAKLVKVFPKNKKILFSGIVSLTTIVAIAVVVLGTNPTRSLIDAIRNGNYTQATAIYNEEILGNIEKENVVKEKLKEEINNVKNLFKDEKIEYDKAIEELEAIKKVEVLYSEANNAISKITDLNNSRLSYKKGLEFKNSNNLIDAMVEFNKVIKVDSNYGKAQNEIKNISVEFKKQVLSKVESEMAKTEYENALKLLSDALIAMPNDGDFIAKKVNCEKLLASKNEKERKQLMKKLIAEQEVAVVGTSEYTDSIDTNFITVTLKNRTKKTVKSYSIGFMGFDRNGLPIKVGLAGGEFVGTGYNDQNILPGETKNSDGGWYLDNHDVKTLIACIDEVEYYDGEKWENPYYAVWLEQYAEKPLK